MSEVILRLVWGFGFRVSGFGLRVWHRASGLFLIERLVPVFGFGLGFGFGFELGFGSQVSGVLGCV